MVFIAMFSAGSSALTFARRPRLCYTVPRFPNRFSQTP